MTTDQNPIKKPEALRLADMADVTDRSTNWQEWKREAAATLRTQHALLESNKEALEACVDALERIRDQTTIQTSAEVVARKTLAALNQHLDQP